MYPLHCCGVNVLTVQLAKNAPRSANQLFLQTRRFYLSSASIGLHDHMHVCHKSSLLPSINWCKMSHIAYDITTPILSSTQQQYFQKRNFMSFTKLQSQPNCTGEKKFEKLASADDIVPGDDRRNVTEDTSAEVDCSKLSMVELETLYKDSTFTPIFHFPYILVARLISRLKLFQTGLTITILPPITYSYLSGTSTLFMVQVSYTVATVAALVLYAMSAYFRRLIGVVSISEDGKVIRVGRLTFWGNRKNLFYCVDDVIPFSDLSDNPDDVFINFKTYGSTDLLYISLKHGNIKDSEKFAKVFGSKLH